MFEYLFNMQYIYSLHIKRVKKYIVRKVGKIDQTGRTIGYRSVSYTHLDVYKRQALGGRLVCLYGSASPGIITT